MRVLEVTDVNAPGPGQIANEMQQDDEVVDELQEFRVAGAPPPIFGNILTLPIDDGLVHIEPVYAARTADVELPDPAVRDRLLRRRRRHRDRPRPRRCATPSTRIDTGQPEPHRVRHRPTTRPTTPPDDPPDTGGGELTIDEQIADLLARADAKFTAADAAQRAGDTVRWAKLMEEGRDLIAKALGLVDERRRRSQAPGRAGRPGRTPDLARLDPVP